MASSGRDPQLPWGSGATLQNTWVLPWVLVAGRIF